MLDQELPSSDYAVFYLALPKRRRKIFQYLLWFQNRFPTAFPKMAGIAKYAGLTPRAVQKFFKILEKENRKHFYLRVEARFNRFGGNTSNRYVLNNNFKMAMEWLKIYGFLNSPSNKTMAIISSMKKEEKVHPPSPQKFTPLSKDSSFSRDQKKHPKEKPSVNLLFNGIKIEEAVKVWASNVASDREIYESLETCSYRSKHGGVMYPTRYFVGALRNIVFKHRGVRV